MIAASCSRARSESEGEMPPGSLAISDLVGNDGEHVGRLEAGGRLEQPRHQALKGKEARQRDSASMAGNRAKKNNRRAPPTPRQSSSRFRPPYASGSRPAIRTRKSRSSTESARPPRAASARATLGGRSEPRGRRGPSVAGTPTRGRQRPRQRRSPAGAAQPGAGPGSTGSSGRRRISRSRTVSYACTTSVRCGPASYQRTTRRMQRDRPSPRCPRCENAYGTPGDTKPPVTSSGGHRSPGGQRI